MMRVVATYLRLLVAELVARFYRFIVPDWALTQGD